MPHRVEPYPMSTSQPQPAYAYAQHPTPPNKHRKSPYERRASPPPIATLPSHSGSSSPANSSLDRSAVSTPPIGRRASPPPAQAPHAQQHAPPPYPYDMQRYPPGTYMYAGPQYAHPQDQQRYSSQGQPQYAPPPQAYGYVPYPLPGAPPPGPGPAIQIIHTDDAATKLSDRVRRRCFNCCTTDTSTWRRSNLSPGKVLCNKCGLFERTHSRPRPEQFPHKRGPLATSSLRARSPPQQQQPKQQQQPYATYAPPAPAANSASAPAPALASAPPSSNGAQQNGHGHASPNINATSPNPNLSGSRPASRAGEREERSRERD
ncbi:hypothetical protein C8R46DRAFT_1062599 [Mycena filopes]|nr:hypothetical protein C8R46DRAFT_1062599 [Mycena filopes]